VDRLAQKEPGIAEVAIVAVEWVCCKFGSERGGRKHEKVSGTLNGTVVVVNTNGKTL